LLKIHGHFLESTRDLPEVDCWRHAYNVFAHEFSKRHRLTDELVSQEIPRMVADAGASGRWKWGRYGLQSPMGDCIEKLGAEFYVPWFIHGYFLRFLEGRINHWRGMMIVVSAGAESVNRKPGRATRALDSSIEATATKARCRS
jgi:hypothetical protein